ncbi:DUF4516 domain-containing protein [archaeon]|nr:MAG: DUF4516 domain-containing protein [archaeon]
MVYPATIVLRMPIFMKMAYLILSTNWIEVESIQFELGNSTKWSRPTQKRILPLYTVRLAQGMRPVTRYSIAFVASMSSLMAGASLVHNILKPDVVSITQLIHSSYYLLFYTLADHSRPYCGGEVKAL